MLAADLYERINRRLDLEPSDYHTDEELEAVSVEAYLDMWDIMIAAMGEEAPWELTTLTTTPGQAYIDVLLSAGVYRMGRLDFRGNSESFEPMMRFNMASDPMHSTAQSWSGPGSVRYFARRAFRMDAALLTETTGRLFSWKIYFDPIPAAVHQVRLFFIPGPAIEFDAAGPVVSYPNEWPEYVVNDVAAKMRMKEEADPTEFERSRDRQAVIIERYCKPHQINSPQFMADHRRLQSPDHDPAIDSFWRR